MRGAKLYAMLAAMFMAGAFLASAELRAYAANTVRSIDIVDGQVMTVDLANNAVTSAKIKDGEVKAADIATDSVGAAELQGVTKLLFAKCILTATEGNTKVNAGDAIGIGCKIAGVTFDDQVVASLNFASSCFVTGGPVPQNGVVSVPLVNTCKVAESTGTKAYISLIVYHK